MKTHQQANLLANKHAYIKANLQDKQEYIDYYMMFYRSEYKKQYDMLYQYYKEEYLNKIRKKYKNSENICVYHTNTITWLKTPYLNGLDSPV